MNGEKTKRGTLKHNRDSGQKVEKRKTNEGKVGKKKYGKEKGRRSLGKVSWARVAAGPQNAEVALTSGGDSPAKSRDTSKV